MRKKLKFLLKCDTHLVFKVELVIIINFHNHLNMYIINVNHIYTLISVYKVQNFSFTCLSKTAIISSMKN